jgi:hypothetical protein
MRQNFQIIYDIGTHLRKRMIFRDFKIPAPHTDKEKKCNALFSIGVGVNINAYICIFIYLYMYMYICIYICINIRIYTSVYLYVY